ncbi:hypothetical protein Tco_1497906 [Tanacetum coccineum]
MGRGRSKAKKKSVGSSRAGSSLFVDLVADKFLNMKQKIGNEVRGKTVLYRLEESGVEYPGGRVNDDVEYDSPVEEVSPVKPKKPSRRTARAKKDAPEEPPKDWTVSEETVLCQAWCDVSENNFAENSMKTIGF